MSKKPLISTDGGDDKDFERNAAELERQKRHDEEERYKKYMEEKRRKEKAAQQARDKKIAEDKLELMKLKSGVIEESEELKEEHTPERKLSFGEKVVNFWYHDKIWIIFTAFVLFVVGFIIYDTVTRVQPDITVMLICDNALTSQISCDKLEERIEKYTPDLNGDGKIKVSVMNCPLNDEAHDTMYATNNQKFFSNLQQGRIIMVITDGNTDPDYQALMDDSLTEVLPDNPYVDEKGLSLNMAFLAEELECENMPNDVHLCLRRPVTTLDDTQEEMQENYDTNLEIFKALANDLAREAQECGDKGITADTELDSSTVGDSAS